MRWNNKDFRVGQYFAAREIIRLLFIGNERLDGYLDLIENFMVVFILTFLNRMYFIMPVGFRSVILILVRREYSWRDHIKLFDEPIEEMFSMSKY